MSTKYQTIIITLSNGNTVQATVPAFCTQEEVEANEIHLTSINITDAKPLPENYKWEPIYKEN